MLKRNRIVEARLVSWKADAALLTGHTHEACFAEPGSRAYFNTGCCFIPGQITGIELQAGQLSLVRWTGESGLDRELLAGPRSLSEM
jgi:hypothetical protein